MTTTTPLEPDENYRTRALAEPTIYAYVGGPGKERFITDFEGKIIGRIRESRVVNLPRWSYVHGSTITWYRVLMDDGVMRYGRSSPCIAITLHAYANQDKYNAR